MNARVKVLVEAKHLVLSRLVRLANQEELDPILEAQRTAVICRSVIEQGLVTLEECEALHRGCSLSNAAILEPKADAAKTFHANILKRLQHPEPLNDISLQVVQATLTSVMRLFVEHGALMQIGLNQRIVDHKVPKSPKKLSVLPPLMERIDREHWLRIYEQYGQGALVAASTSIKKTIRKKHTPAPQLIQQDDHA